ncbi:DUF3019 domain-containing protein [Ningiella sp. W23]|uniref:DUF3019 domain-containing protein n=1 Tax=Ningiella sp. W23 TaxID=3023715 RepID=UPI003756AB96
MPRKVPITLIVKRICCIISLFMGCIFTLRAQELSISIIPHQCVVMSQEEGCETQLQIDVLTFNATPSDDELCIFTNGTRQICMRPKTTPSVQIPIIIKKDLRVEIRALSGKLVFDKVIPYKVINTSPKRRRVKLPWSIF